jgi:paraquat-inducible protein A
MEATRLIACHQCDMLYRRAPLPERATARCQRCGALLYRSRHGNLDRPLALAISGLVLFTVANIFPMLTFNFEGQFQDATLLSGIITLHRQGMSALAALVLTTTIVVPLVQLGGYTYILLPLRFNHVAVHTARLLRWIRYLQPWGMLEVFMLGILVSVVKLSSLAEIVAGIALYAFMALIFVLAAAISSLDLDLIWSRLEIKQ